MRRLLIIALLTVAACAPDATEPRSAQTPGDPTRPQLETDYRFEAYPGSQWYGPDGDEIPEESRVINAITGPDHCDWEAGVMMHVGWPPGHDAADISESRQYLRDPERVFPQDSFMTKYDANVELPDRAEYTGYRTDFMELWLDNENDRAAYLVFADHVELWPRARQPIACA
ncbi:MAG TPA: hypothetical protein VHJ82_04235 [Actinomycetota bacterium]|nr:hypothetical protein [Actinomycetota bacterium]